MLAAALAAALCLGALPPADDGFLRGPEFRWPHRNVLVRTAADFLALPASVSTWQPEEWAELSLWTGAVLALMTGRPSWDVRLQGWLHESLGPPGTRFTLHTPLGDALLWAGTGVIFGTLGLVGWLRDVPPLAEVFSLALEAFVVSEVLHVVMKLLVGREAPGEGLGLGEVRGPPGALKSFPGGTPSGHATAMYALLGVVSTYVGRPWLTALLQLFGAAFAASLVVDDYHYLSDVLWGAAMGWNVGRWVVHHRSSRGAPPKARVQVVPVAVARPFGVGVLATVAF